MRMPSTEERGAHVGRAHSGAGQWARPPRRGRYGSVHQLSSRCLGPASSPRFEALLQGRGRQRCRVRFAPNLLAHVPEAHTAATELLPASATTTSLNTCRTDDELAVNAGEGQACTVDIGGESGSVHRPQGAARSCSGGLWGRLRGAVKNSTRVIVGLLGLVIVAYGASSVGTLFWILGLPVMGFGLALFSLGLARLRWGNVVIGVGFAIFGASVAISAILLVHRPDWVRLALALAGYGLAFIAMGVARMVDDRAAAVTFTVGGIWVIGLGQVVQIEVFNIAFTASGVTLACYGVAALRWCGVWDFRKPSARR
jgi:hypothetical protein